MWGDDGGCYLRETKMVLLPVPSVAVVALMIDVQFRIRKRKNAGLPFAGWSPKPQARNARQPLNL